MKDYVDALTTRLYLGFLQAYEKENDVLRLMNSIEDARFFLFRHILEKHKENPETISLTGLEYQVLISELTQLQKTSS